MAAKLIYKVAKLPCFAISPEILEIMWSIMFFCLFFYYSPVLSLKKKPKNTVTLLSKAQKGDDLQGAAILV